MLDRITAALADRLILSPTRHRVPALFVVALRDRVVPAHCQRLILDAYGGAHKLLEQPEADHATPLFASEVARLRTLADWLLNEVERQRSESQPNAGRQEKQRNQP